MRIIELEEHANTSQLNPFYISFSDLMVLLCSFFVMIIAMSKVEVGSFEKIKAGFTGDTKGTLVALSEDLKNIADKTEGIKVTMAEDGVRLDLDTAVLFSTGSSELQSEKLAPLRPMLKKIKNTAYKIDVEGHTDDVPLYKIVGKERDSNWSLSGRRAASVIHYLQDYGFKDARLRLVGYGSTKPKEEIKGKRGQELERIRAQNRRVTLLVR